MSWGSITWISVDFDLIHNISYGVHRPQTQKSRDKSQDIVHSTLYVDVLAPLFTRQSTDRERFSPVYMQNMQSIGKG